MKKYFYIALTAVIGMSTVFMTACSESSETNKPDGTEKITALVMTADKSTVEADSKDAAVFTVTDQNGNDVTSNKSLRIMNAEDNSFLDGNKLTMFENGEVTYYARINGIPSNKVTVTGENRKTYEKYYRHVALYQITGTWCQACPTLTKTLAKVEAENLPGRLIRLTCHGGDDPYAISAADQLLVSFGLNSYPTGIVDLRQAFGNASVSTIVTAVRNSIKASMAACGVKISTKLTGMDLEINPEITFDKEGEFSVGYAILVDKLEYPQVGATEDETYLHNNTVRAFSNLYGGAIGAQTAGAKWTPTTPFKATLAKEFKVEDTRVVVYVLKKEGDKWYINNLATCKADNGSVDYKLND